MDRTEFIEILRSQLSGQMQEGRASAHVRYYEDYIQSQVRSGRTEAEVLAELGDPRLIAKTLIDTNVENETDTYDDYQESYRNKYQSDGNQTTSKHKYKLDLSTWYGKAIVILCAVVIVVALVALIGTILPFLIVFAIILYFISWLKKRH